MSYHSGVSYHPNIVTPGHMPVAGMPIGGMPVGTPYATPYGGNALMMGGMGSEYGTPLVDSYPPVITRTPSIYDTGRRSLYEEDLYDHDSRYGRDYFDRDYDRGRRYYDDDDYYPRRSSSRASRRSSRRDYDDYYYDRDYSRYDDGYYDAYRSPRYYSSRSYGSGYHSGYYPSSSSRYYSSRSRSGRRREDMSIITKTNGDVKVLRNGEERIGDRVRRMFGLDPKGVNVVRLKRGESLAANVRR
ncbi:hypothetical protein CPB86DRAFT_692183 [Serendipita vermifera]|nr:hypothetical protein CPB86DRAFT_692183 [Serendipita vermifera]